MRAQTQASRSTRGRVRSPVKVDRSNRHIGSRWRAAAVAMTLGCASAMPAHADSISDYVRFELGAGISHYEDRGDGIWVQYGMEHTEHLSAPVLMGGLTGPLWKRDSWGVDWHADYVYLAHVSSQCECTPMDQNYDPAQHRLLNLYNVQNANFVGSGYAQGIALTVESYYRYSGWRIGVEGGLFPYIPTWDETIYNWQPLPGVPTQTITAHTRRSINLGEVVGLSVGRGPLSISYQHYFLPSRAGSPPIWSGADVLMLRYRF